MPKLGRPQGNSKNPFGQIGLRRGVSKASEGEKDVGSKLNKMAGNEASSFRFVDGDKHNKLGKDGFLKLLTHQLANQDPTNPVDQKKFASELAAISQLEQLTNMNSKLDRLSPNATTQAKFFAASFLGKEVRTSGTSIDFDGASERTTIPFELDRDANNVMINLKDKKDQLIKQIELTDLKAGVQSAIWDGLASDNLPASKGEYRIEIKAFDKSGAPFNAKTQAFGKVTSVHSENGELILTLDGKKKVFLRDVENFRLPRENNLVHNNSKNMVNKGAPQVNSKQLKAKIDGSYGKQQN